MEEVKKRKSKRSPELDAIKKKIRNGEGKINRLFDMIEAGIAGPDVKDRNMECREVINVLQERAQTLLNAENLSFTEDMARRYLQTYRESLERKDSALKRKTLEKFVERIEVLSDCAEFQFKIEPGQRVDKVGGDGPSRTVSNQVILFTDLLWKFPGTIPRVKNRIKSIK